MNRRRNSNSAAFIASPNALNLWKFAERIASVRISNTLRELVAAALQRD